MSEKVAADRIAAVRKGQLVRRGTRAQSAGTKDESKKGMVQRSKTLASGLTEKAAKSLEQLDDKLVAEQEKNDLHVSQMVDSAKIAAVKKVLGMMRTATAEMAKPPYAPRRLCDMADYIHAGVWPELEQQLESSMLASVTSSGKKLKQSQLRGWAKAPRLWRRGAKPWRSCPVRPFAFLRAKVLYAIFPADGNKFKHFQDPLALTILLIKMCPLYGVNVLVFILVFLLIDRSDECQLIRYILSFKTFQFISGVMGYAKLGLKFMKCLEAEAMGEMDSCRALAPGSTAGFPFIMSLEVARIVLLMAAGIALAGGGAYGGAEEILALEDARQKMAQQRVKAERAEEERETTASGDGYARLEEGAERDVRSCGGGGSGAPAMSAADFRPVIAASRFRFGVQRTRGGYLPHFMLYDGIVVSVLGLILGLTLLRYKIYGAPLWLFWAKCQDFKLWWVQIQHCHRHHRHCHRHHRYHRQQIYDNRTTTTPPHPPGSRWALLSAPYLIFTVPVLGQSLHRAKTTAYDQVASSPGPFLLLLLIQCLRPLHCLRPH
jgi:hypothetical protein